MVVVGAGISGLVAAQSLQRLGYEVLVLEAQDEIGGRTKTTKTGPFAGVERGAHWIHGGADNFPLSELLSYYNISQLWVGGNDEFEGPRERLSVFDGERSLTAEEIGKASNLSDDFQDAITPHEVRKLLAAKDREISIGQAWLEAPFWANLSASESRLLEWQVRVRSEQRWGEDPNMVGVRTSYLSEYRSWYLDEENGTTDHGNSDTRPEGGFSNLVEHLARGLQIRVASPVRSVTKRSDGVVVTTDNETFRAAAVVVTTSVGALQKGTITFDPVLPKAWGASVASVRMGRMAKLLIRFGEGLSPLSSDTYLLSRLTTMQATKFLYYCVSEATDRLECLVGSGSARELERVAKSGNDVLKEHVLRELHELWPALPDAALEAVDLVSWADEPFIHGSWSVSGIHASSEDLDVIGQPQGRIRFAGEGTCRLMSGTVHGAIVSGARAAYEWARDDGGGVPEEVAAEWPPLRPDFRHLCDFLPAYLRVNSDAEVEVSQNCRNTWEEVVEKVPSLFSSWGAMTAAERRHWQRMGWSSLSWARQARIPLKMFYRWNDLRTCHREALRKLGFRKKAWQELIAEQASFVVCRNRPSHFMQPWDNMLPAQRRDWTILGWSRAYWDEEGGAPDTAKKKWRHLKESEKAAARRLGYSRNFW